MQLCTSLYRFYGAQELLEAIQERLEQAYEDTLEDVIELLDIRASEDVEDLKVKKELASE